MSYVKKTPAKRQTNAEHKTAKECDGHVNDDTCVTFHSQRNDNVNVAAKFHSEKLKKVISKSSSRTKCMCIYVLYLWVRT